MSQTSIHLRDAVLGSLVLLALLAGIAFLNQDGLLVAHHRSRFAETQSEQAGLNVSDFTTKAEYDARSLELQHQLFHHQSRLLELNAIRQLDSVIPNIKWDDPACRALIARLDVGDPCRIG